MSETETPGTEAPSWEESMRLLDRLPALAVGERAEAIKVLLRNPSPGVRERALRVGAAVLPQATLADYLGNDADAVLRNAGLEILKLRARWAATRAGYEDAREHMQRARDVAGDRWTEEDEALLVAYGRTPEKIE